MRFVCFKVWLLTPGREMEGVKIGGTMSSSPPLWWRCKVSEEKETKKYFTSLCHINTDVAHR